MFPLSGLHLDKIPRPDISDLSRVQSVPVLSQSGHVICVDQLEASISAESVTLTLATNKQSEFAQN